MFKQLSRPWKNIYVGAILRDQLDIGHYIGRPITISEFIHYVVERHGDEAKDNLKRILCTEEERKQPNKKRR